MAFRGRGRGRGGRGGAFERFAKHEPFILFPENVNLPTVPDFPLPQEEQALITWKVRLEKFLKDSCYHLQEAAPKSKKHDGEIERYSDRFKSKTQVKRESLASYLKLTSSNFPPELIQGSKRVQPDNKKKLKWGRDSDEQLLDMFEKLEETNKGTDEKDGKDKKGESEDEEELEEEAEEESSDDDYNQNIDFDDDEDDWNMEEEEQEDFYE